MKNWFLSWLKKTPKEDAKRIESLEAVLIQAANANAGLVDAIGMMRMDFNHKKQALVQFIMSILLQHNGQMTVNKNFIDAVKANDTLNLEIKTLDSGDVEAYLVEAAQE